MRVHRSWIAVVVLSWGLTSGAVAQPMKVGVLQELAPFGPPVAEVLRGAGILSDVILEPTARLSVDLKTGAVDLGYLFSEVTLNTIPDVTKVPVVLFQNEYVAVTARSDLKIQSLSDLAHLRVGYVRGNVIYEKLLAEVPLAIPESLTDAVLAFKMLGGGRVDVLLSTSAAVVALGPLAERPLYPQSPPLVTVPLYLAISNRAKERLPQVTAAFDRAVKSGEWAKMVKDTLELMRVGASKP